MAKDAYYFSHDSNARNDPKIVAMMTKHQWFGYGLYWALIELMREQDGYKIKLEKHTYNALAMQLYIDAKHLHDFVSDCVGEFKLFKQEKGYLFSDSLIIFESFFR